MAVAHFAARTTTPKSGSAWRVLHTLLPEPLADLPVHGGAATLVTLADRTVLATAVDERAVDYLRRLLEPGNSLWQTAAPAYQAAPPENRMDAVPLPRGDVHILLDAVRTAAVGAPVPTRLHVGAPAAWYPLADGAAALLLDESAGDGIDPQAVIRVGDDWLVVYCAEGDGWMNLARHTRELGYRVAEDNGWTCLHSSAFLLGGDGYLVVGDSGAGKTTLALGMAQYQGGGFLANDRVMARDQPDGTVEVAAMPVPIRANGGTLRALGLTRAYDWRLVSRKPPPDSDWQDFHGDTKLHVLPGEWRRETGTTLAGQATTRAVLLPRVVSGSARVTVAPVPPAMVHDAVRRQCMTPVDPVYVEDWLGVRSRDTTQLAVRAASLVTRLSQLPAYTVEFGTEVALGQVAEVVADVLAGPAPEPAA